MSDGFWFGMGLVFVSPLAGFGLAFGLWLGWTLAGAIHDSADDDSGPFGI